MKARRTGLLKSELGLTKLTCWLVSSKSRMLLSQASGQDRVLHWQIG